MVESAEGNGIEAWRLLSQKYNPRTHSRCLQLVRSISNFRVPRMDDVLTGLVRWEAPVAMPARDHKEVLSEKLRTALMISILPQTLQERAVEHFDRLTTYNDVHAKIIGLVQASSRYSASDAMGCSAVDEYTEEDEDSEINALSKNHCTRCDGYGHYAQDCPTPPAKAKGKGKQKASRQETDAPSGKGGMVCSYCKRPNHTKDKWWGVHPELKRESQAKAISRRVAGLDEEAEADDADVLGFLEIGAIDACAPCGGHDFSDSCCSQIRATGNSVITALT